MSSKKLVFNSPAVILNSARGLVWSFTPMLITGYYHEGYDIQYFLPQPLEIYKMNKNLLVIVPTSITVKINSNNSNFTQLDNTTYQYARKLCKLPELPISESVIEYNSEQSLPWTTYPIDEGEKVVPEIMSEFHITKFQAIYVWLIFWCHKSGLTNDPYLYRFHHYHTELSFKTQDGSFHPLSSLSRITNAIINIDSYPTPRNLIPSKLIYGDIGGESKLNKAIDIYYSEKIIIFDDDGNALTK